MSDQWSHQLRIYLPEGLAEAAYRGEDGALRPLTLILEGHDATMTSQFKAFEDYVSEAEINNADDFPLYRWTKATIEDPAMRAKHIGSFAIRVGGQELYGKDVADAIAHDVRPLVGGELVKRMSRHNTDPANNIPIPSEYQTK